MELRLKHGSREIAAPGLSIPGGAWFRQRSAMTEGRRFRGQIDLIPAALDVDSSVMAGLVPAIYDFHRRNKDMDGRNEPGHDGSESNTTVDL
jgi:hypothetical protein